jgi:hypothetical protein
MAAEDDAIESLEIDLKVADIGELLKKHGVAPTPELVTALWNWAEGKRRG